MAIRDLLPINRSNRNVPVRRSDWSNPFQAMQREMNRKFDNFFNDFGLSRWEEELDSYFPRVDVRETNKEIQIAAELPGMNEKDIEISVSDDVLTLRGEKRQESEEREGNYYRMERSYGSFHRDVALPAEVETENIDAVFKNGVLTVHIPKKPEAKRKSKKIQIKSS